MVRFRLYENTATSQKSLSTSRADVSPPGNVAAATVKTTDDELLMASVPPPEETPDQQLEQISPSDSIQPRATPSDSGPPTFLPRPKLLEEGSSETRQAAPPATAPWTKSPEEILESKLAPAAVSESELIQPVKKPYINRSQPLAHIMRGSIEMSEARKSADVDAKDSPASPVVRGSFRVMFAVTLTKPQGTKPMLAPRLGPWEAKPKPRCQASRPRQTLRPVVRSNLQTKMILLMSACHRILFLGTRTHYKMVNCLL